MKFLATSLLLYLSFLLDELSCANAIRISGVRNPREGYGGGAEGLERRGTLLAASDTLKNDGDLKYLTNVTLNEEVFVCLIDTGRCVH